MVMVLAFGIRKPPLSPNLGEGVNDAIGREVLKVKIDDHCSVPG